MQTYYDVFHRTWWDPWHAPRPGKKHYISFHVTWNDARALCQEWNAAHEPGELSDKAEFEESEG